MNQFRRKQIVLQRVEGLARRDERLSATLGTSCLPSDKYVEQEGENDGKN